MPANEWNVCYPKHQIRVVKTQSDSARLYVYSELLFTTNGLYASEGEPTLIGISGENDMFQVEAFVRPSEHAQAGIRVKGRWIAGERGYAAASD